MSNKYLRHVLQEREKIAAEPPELKEEGAEISDDDDCEESAVRNKFSALGLNSGSDSKDSDDAESESVDVSKVVSGSGAKKAEKRKKKKCQNKVHKEEEAELEHAEDESSVPKEDTIDHRLQLLWKIDPRSLDGDFELKRLIGRSFGERRERRVHGRPTTGKMVKAKPEWPPIRQTGIAMIAEGGVEGEIHSFPPAGPCARFRFRHSQRYQLLQQMFWLHQSQQDHESIMNAILPENPYHLDSLLTLAEMLYTLQEDYQQARDVVERGLYACETAFHSQFQLLSPLHHLSYRWRENRAFFLLLHRHTQMLAQRMCFSTALQFAKILLMKSKEEDPFATILLIDSLALRAGEHRFLTEFYECLRTQKKLDLLPNFLFSLSLAYFLSSSAVGEESEEGRRKARECLLTALLRFPFMLGQILDKLQIHADNPIEGNYSLNSMAINRESPGLRLIARIYLYHNVEVWKQPNVIAWLESTTHELLPQLSSNAGKEEMKEWAQQRKRCFVGIPLSVKRHALLHSIHFADIDPSDHSGDGANYLTDPYPPKDTQEDYAPADLSAINGRQVMGEERSVLGGLVRSLIPDDLHPRLDNLGEMLNHYATSLVDRLKSQLNMGNGGGGTSQAGGRDSTEARNRGRVEDADRP